MNHRYKQSERFLERSTQAIPLGSQTFSKSRVSLPYGVSPYFVESAQGCQLTDIDQNQYTDYVSALLSVSLGYCDPDVDAAVKKQIDNGVTFSLPHRLETECAEQLIELIPCAEQVRFGKNGTDATSAAIRLSRAYTGRDHIAVCGYHGWQDWYIGSTTRDLGVPSAVKELTHPFQYNNIASLEALFAEYHGSIAAVIMEPMSFEFPEKSFLESIKALCQKEGAVLIFDEMITGFRFDLGGAQTLFSVTPDLATFGKGMANGFPLSAVVGRRDIMLLMNEIFYSGTFAGETLSLAACVATVDKMMKSNVLNHTVSLGEYLLTSLHNTIHETGCESIFSVVGHPSWSQLVISHYNEYDPLTLKTFILQSLFEQGQFFLGTHNLNYSHQMNHIDALIKSYSEVFTTLKNHCDRGILNDHIKSEILAPLFKVRNT